MYVTYGCDVDLATTISVQVVEAVLLVPGPVGHSIFEEMVRPSVVVIVVAATPLMLATMSSMAENDRIAMRDLKIQIAADGAEWRMAADLEP